MAIHVPRGRVRDDPFQQVPLDFGALQLRDDPQEVGWRGAIDALNVTLDQPGRLRSRDGFAKFSTASMTTNAAGMAPFYKSDGTSQLLVATANGSLFAYNTSGAQVSSVAAAGVGSYLSVARFGGPTAEAAYVVAGFQSASSAVSQTVRKWDGAAFSATLAGESPMHFAITPNDNRLAFSSLASGKVERVKFSNEGAPETIGVNDYVDLTPGDGEMIRAMVTWREMLFVFKETKFFVFYGNSTDSTGATEFNYRTVACGVGPPSARGVSVSERGVTFAGRDGIYLTTGGPPTLLSRPIDPVFRGSIPAYSTVVGIRASGIWGHTLHWYRDRLYFVYTDTNSAQKMLVYDPEVGWLPWSLPALALATWRISGDEEMVLGWQEGSGDNEIGRFAASTTDNGTAIDSYYRTGFADLGMPMGEKILRELLIDGVGTPTVKVAVNDGALDTGAAVTLGTSPTIAQGRHRRAYRGRNFSVQFGATSAWSASRAVANTLGGLPPGGRTT